MERLFIFGSIDGERREVKDHFLVYSIPVMPKLTGVVAVDFAKSSFHIDSYRLETIHTPTDRYEFFILRGKTAGEAIARLIEGYKKPES